MPAAAFPLRPVSHDEVLPLTDHLTELRARLIVCGAVLVTLFGLCLWQSRPLLDVLNRPLASIQTHDGTRGGAGASDQREVRAALARSGAAFDALASGGKLDLAQRRAAAAAAASLAVATRELARPQDKRPVTIGLGEPFSTSMTVAGAFALLLALPLLLWQAWGFAAPAVAPADRRPVRALIGLASVLFVAGVAFAYIMVLPPAVRFLQGFNGGAFDALVQARDYYHFELVTMLAVGGIFQLPVLALALGRAGLVDATLLRAKRRYAIVALAVLAALLPGTDPVTTALELVPLVGLYELSILLLASGERRRAKAAANGPVA